MIPRSPLLLACLCLPFASQAVDDDLGAFPFKGEIVPYEPVWFLADPGWTTERGINAKFQVSLAFRLVGDPEAKMKSGDVRRDGFYLSYSQTSYWDLHSASKPFIDTSYRPEGWWHQHLGNLAFGGLDAVEFGAGHESNGKGGTESRSLNRLLLRPLAHWNVGGDWLVRASPRAGYYVGDMADNPDMVRYRGYFDLEAGLGSPSGWWTGLRSRIGNEWDRANLQVDVDYPLNSLTEGWMKGFIHVQWYWGWSESLIAYDQKVEQPRLLVGLALTH